MGPKMQKTARWSIAVLLLLSRNHAAAETGMIRLELSGQTLEGSPLHWTSEQALLLGRDGHLWKLDPRQAIGLEPSADRFRGYSQAEMRGRLLAEFGRRYEVTGTGHFLVVHPGGERDAWAGRFEELYRSFMHYFAVRGFRPHPPAYPLVAIVLDNREQFLRYALKAGVRLPSNVLGYYSPGSNRILMYDQRVGTRDNSNWRLTATTIIHEAAHQSAFNTGIHNRFAPQPRWLVEGLGMLFEAKGVYDSRRYPHRADRINRERLAKFNHSAQQRPAGSVAELISSDRRFQQDPDAAYAEAWALSFYLAEMQPQQYLKFLAKTAKRQSFVAYSSPHRLRDFTEAFGMDLTMLESQMSRFINSLK